MSNCTLLKKRAFIHGDPRNKIFGGHDVDLYSIQVSLRDGKPIIMHERFGRKVCYYPNNSTYVWGDGGSAANIGDVLVHDPDMCNWRSPCSAAIERERCAKIAEWRSCIPFHLPCAHETCAEIRVIADRIRDGAPPLARRT